MSGPNARFSFSPRDKPRLSVDGGTIQLVFALLKLRTTKLVRSNFSKPFKALPNVSYTYIRKRLEWFGKITPDQFRGTQFQKREDQLYLVQFFKRENVRFE